MNFHFPGSPLPIHQFAPGALVSSSSSSANPDLNRYHSNNVNIPHFTNQPHLGKFRSDDVGVNSNMNKYNGHTNQYSVAYSQESQIPSVNDKHRTTTSATNGSPSSHGMSISNAYQQTGQGLVQSPEIVQQSDQKRYQNSSSTWQSLTPSSAVADYLSHLPASTLPLSLHHFLKYSAENIKKESSSVHTPLNGQTMNNLPGLNNNLNLQGNHHNVSQLHQINQSQGGNNNQTDHNNQSATITGTGNMAQNAAPAAPTKKKKKKKAPKPPKEKKPRPKPGEIRLTTALDGSTLFCCPECQMAYPERGLLEQHLVGHNLERRFICDICNAALKRKDHLTRHKQSHNPERPFVCTICLKAFKRKEQLTLHFVIHSGEKRHICNECGKGFYRKDHLRKHTRSHIARRVKAELSQQNQPGTSASSPVPPVSSSSGNNTNNNNNATIVVPNLQQHQQIQQQMQQQQLLQINGQNQQMSHQSMS